MNSYCVFDTLRISASRPWHRRLGIDSHSFADDASQGTAVSIERPWNVELELCMYMYATMFNASALHICSHGL